MYEYYEKPLADIDFQVLKISEKQPSRYQGQLLSDQLMSFDIETTSYFLTPAGYPVMYNWNNPQMLWDGIPMRRQGLMYHWQFNIGGNHFTGRTWEDLAAFLQELLECCPARKFIYVHNLSFEFGFLPNVISFSDEGDVVLAREAHRIMSAYTKKYNIEFRCSSYLTQLSLEKWGKNIGLEKSKDLDYSEMRTPLTPISPQELRYCLIDVDIIIKGLEEYKARYKHIHNIPLTLTGEVRKELRKVYKGAHYFYKICWELQPHSLKALQWMMKAFYGGCVLANPAYKDMLLRGRFIFKDLSSSYPWVLISERYPLTKFRLVRNPKVFSKYMNDPDLTYIVEFTAENVETRVPCLFLSASKLLESDGLTMINGRVATASRIRLVLAKPDYQLFLKCYYSDIKIHKIKISNLEYLPDNFRRFVIEKYKAKTELKHSDPVEYGNAKKTINSLYGINAQKLYSDEVTFDINRTDGNGDCSPWAVKELTAESFPEVLHKVLYSESGKPRKIFISAQIGIYCTAYARQNLWAGILGEDPTTHEYINADDAVYSDTDSVKLIWSEEAERFFEKYNEGILEKHKEIAAQLGIQPEDLSPLDDEGVPRPIGVYADDGDASEFITLGSKKYCYRAKGGKHDGQLQLTVAGVPKEAVTCLHNDIKEFRDGKVFDVVSMNREGLKSKMAPYYNDNQTCVTFPDGYWAKESHGICLMPIDYTLSKSWDNYSDPDDFYRTLWAAARETKLFR